MGKILFLERKRQVGKHAEKRHRNVRVIDYDNAPGNNVSANVWLFGARVQY